MDGPRDCYTEWSKSDRKGEISCDIPYMCILKRNDTNEFTKQKETHTEQTYGCQGKKQGVWDGQVKPSRTCCVAHGILLSALWQPGWEGSLGENGHVYVYMAESPHYLPGTTATLLISYTPIQNKKFEKWKK